ncbi:UNVERIFIED_CONTAM: hypothetical protein FKN15_020709 [Acipenser sinensis]
MMFSYTACTRLCSAKGCRFMVQCNGGTLAGSWYNAVEGLRRAGSSTSLSVIVFQSLDLALAPIDLFLQAINLLLVVADFLLVVLPQGIQLLTLLLPRNKRQQTEGLA